MKTFAADWCLDWTPIPYVHHTPWADGGPDTSLETPMFGEDLED